MAEIRTDVLLIDDDRELCDLLREYFVGESLSFDAVYDGPAGLSRLSAGGVGLVILDVMLPGKNGFDVLREIRAMSTVPVLMLTARGREVDRIVGLEMGADDYLAKPFNPRELVARIRAIHRRVAPGGSARAESDVVEVGDVRVHVASRTATLAGEPLALTTAEFDLLVELVRQAGRVLSREELCLSVLGRRFSPLDRSLDVHVSNLRKKIGQGLIKTVRGHGYLLARPEP
ncbi:MAG: response regulator [Sandaracinaceae bacterium]